ncbi:acyltransferase [Aliivibrio finisterrensis]|uniref:Acyltransferase n=2 Tax=Aliivibrio finisterrensis TaxID=511998 RepID=A0A6N6RTQ9_9GAMM|nr:acyltransferase [Aliivibrio finisterrensis]
MGRVFFFDLLRCIAAIAVVAIHVLAPYRHELNSIPFDQWATAVSVNSVSRWAVPVFIMITGALMLSDKREFDAPYYVKKRLGKVFVPFIFWSVFYALLSGLTAQGYDFEAAKTILFDLPFEYTYYHLGFFYYFIPLYIVIPFFRVMVQQMDNTALFSLISVWLLTTCFFLVKFKGFWSTEIWLYSGYLLLGYALYQRVSLTKTNTIIALLIGITALVTTVYMVISQSLLLGEYTVGRWLSYKTINTVAAAGMLFFVCRYYGESLSDNSRKIVGFISTYSLGIYLLHPLFLWPMKNYVWYQGHNPMWVIPAWVILSGAGALGLSWLLSKSKKTAWLVP